MHIEVIEARDRDLPVVQNLVRYYIYDLSEVMGWDCPDNGLFGGCDSLPEYWETGNPLTDPKYRWPRGRRGHPFIVRVDGKLAGFALIKKLDADSATDYDVGEFFILRKYRRKGVGGYVATHLFDKFPGKWQVRQLPANKPAQAFWRRVIRDYTAGHYDESTGREVIQRFDNHPTP